MKKLCLIVILILCATLTTGVYGFDNETTTLKNGDSETYEYTIKTAGGDLYGKIHADSTAYICKFGCELTLTKTGQTVTVEPGDSVVIDKGVMQVK